MDKNLKQIVTAAEAVKKKFRKMRNCESENEIALGSLLKPVVNPLNQITDAIKQSEMSKKILPTNNYEKKEEMRLDDEVDFDETIKKKRMSDNFMTPTHSLNQSMAAEDDISEQESEEQDEDDVDQLNVSENSSNDQNSSSWSLTSEYMKDIPFGIRPAQGKLMMGSADVNIADETIKIGQRKYKKTPGLMELLTKRSPNLSVISKEDTKNYKIMLLETNAHRRNYDPSKPIKSNKGFKYINIIKPLFNDKITSIEGKGVGIPVLKKVKKNVDYVYWDDPNELVERLKLLIASRDAGNTGLDNEILSIIEELNESGLLK